MPFVQCTFCKKPSCLSHCFSKKNCLLVLTVPSPESKTRGQWSEPILVKPLTELRGNFCSQWMETKILSMILLHEFCWELVQVNLTPLLFSSLRSRCSMKLLKAFINFSSPWPELLSSNVLVKLKSPPMTKGKIVFPPESSAPQETSENAHVELDHRSQRDTIWNYPICS